MSAPSARARANLKKTAEDKRSDIIKLWEAWCEEVKAAGCSPSSLVDIISADARASWHKSGHNQFKCCSPLRQEKSPSFYVYGDQGLWHDFGTDDTGDALKYVRLRDNVGFREALDTLARIRDLPTWDEKKRGRGAPKEDPADLVALFNEKVAEGRVHEVMTAIVHLCHGALPTKARAHLNTHYGLANDFIDFEKIGWVPEGLWDICLERFVEPGTFTEEELLASGFFVVVKGDGRPAHMSGRILFPYWLEGQCVYTIGRQFFGSATLADVVKIEDYDRGKYKKHLIHSSDKRPYVSRFIKNDHFWGEDAARSCGGQPLYITEGVTDAMMLKQLGFNVISPVTTSFSNNDADKAARIGRRASEVVILNDSDVLADGSEPGKKGAIRMAKILFASGVRVRIARLPRPEGVKKTDVNEIGRNALKKEQETAA